MRVVPRVYNIYFINILTVAYRDNIMNTVLYTFNHPINRLKYRVPPLNVIVYYFVYDTGAE